MIDPKAVSYVLVYINSKDQFQKTGIVRAVVVVFKTEPESRMTLWHVKREDGTLDYQVPSFQINCAETSQFLPPLYGKVVEQLAALATRAQEKLAEGLKEKGKKVQYGHIYKVQRQAIEDITSSANA